MKKNLHYFLETENASSALNAPQISDHAENYLSKHKKEIQFLEAIGNIVFLIDYAHLKYAYVSPGTLKIFGCSAEEIMLKGMDFIMEKISKEDQEKVIDVSQEMLIKVLASPSEQRSKITGKYCYRIQSENGFTIPVMQQNKIVAQRRDGQPLLDLCVVSVLTNMKCDNQVRGVLTYPNGREEFIKPKGPECPLSKKEIQLLLFAEQGLTSKEISSKMDLSLETIHRHRKNIMRKLRASNTIESISICKENNWLQQ